MNYQTFSNLQLRPLIKKSFHSTHFDLRKTSGEKTPFVRVGITIFTMMFRKTSNIFSIPNDVTRSLLLDKQRCLSIKILVDKLNGPFARVIGRRSIPFLRKFIVPDAKRVGVDLVEFFASEVAEVVSGRKNFNTAAKSVRKQSLRKQLASGRNKMTATESFQQNLRSKPVGREEKFLKTCLTNHVKQNFGANFLWQVAETLEGKSQ